MHLFYGHPYLISNAFNHAGLRVIPVSRSNVMCAPLWCKREHVSAPEKWRLKHNRSYNIFFCQLNTPQ